MKSSQFEVVRELRRIHILKTCAAIRKRGGNMLQEPF
jgi:hypothetical protein